MTIPDQDVIYLIQSGNGPWTVVSKGDWVAAERRAGFHNESGNHDEPATAGFSSNGHRCHLHGALVYPRYFKPENYSDDSPLCLAILDELERRSQAGASLAT